MTHAYIEAAKLADAAASQFSKKFLGAVLNAGRLTLLAETRQLIVDDKKLTLTVQQFKVLKAMFEMHGEGIAEASKREIFKRAGILQQYSENFRFRDLFKSRPGIWGSVVREGNRGMLRLQT